MNNDNKDNVLFNMEEITCPHCNGEGGEEIGVYCSPRNTMWVSGGDCMELGWEDCKHCKGLGKIQKVKTN